MGGLSDVCRAESECEQLIYWLICSPTVAYSSLEHSGSSLER